MSDGIKAVSVLGSHRYSALVAPQQRAIAVGAALDLIALNVQGANSSSLIESELDRLSAYADKIQEALKDK